MSKFFKRLSQPKQKDYFQEIEERVEHEAVGIRKRRKEIEQEALGGLASFGADVKDTMRAKLTAERLLNAGVWFSQQGKLIEAMAALHVAIEIDNSQVHEQPPFSQCQNYRQSEELSNYDFDFAWDTWFKSLLHKGTV